MGVWNVVTYNVKGINNPFKRKKILGQFKKLHCAVALLQETHLSETEHLKLKREWVDQVYYSFCRNHRKRGVAILFNRSVYFNCEKIFQDKEGRYIMVVGTIEGLKLSILNVYAPNEDCPSFFKKLAHLVADKGEGIVIIGGDLNCVLNNKLNKLPMSSEPPNRMSKSVLNMIKELGLVDSWRHLHPNHKDFTFMSQVHGSYSRLAHFLITKTDIHKVKSCATEPITISDHSPVVMTVDLGQEPCFRYWRINVSLLADISVREEIRSAIAEYFHFNDNGMVSPSVLWDAAKATIRGRLISIASKLKRERLQKQVQIENEIKKLEFELKQQRKQVTLDKLKENRTKLDEILTYKAEGSLRFINQKYYEFGNKAS
uniref:exodeoxyribonuclease III n=1 Tax=Oryzias latipes TaxID=8090 RepID=A0A3B3IK85_ORYLA